MENTKTEERLVFGISIDPDGSKDLDDAFSIKKLDNGTYRLKVFIADVAKQVYPSSRHYMRAMRKTRTLYFSNDSNPMLPKAISEDSASLLPQKKREVFTFTIDISPESYEATLRSIRRETFVNRKRLTYKKAATIIDEHQPNKSSLNRNLIEGFEVAWNLFQKRRDDGALVFYDLTQGLFVDEEGQLRQFPMKEEAKAYILVQEFMILTNKLCAEYFLKNNLSGIFRINPAKFMVKSSKEFAQQLEQALNSGDSKTFELLQDNLKHSFGKASYSAKCDIHSGLNLSMYMQFTSPIRRFPDLVNQFVLSAFLTRKENTFLFEDMQNIATHCNNVLAKQKNAQNKIHIAKLDKETRQSLKEQSFSQLEPGKFSLVLKKAIEIRNFSEHFLQEYKTRLLTNTLKQTDILLLLFKTRSVTDQSGLNELKATIIQLLIAKIPDAKSIIKQLCDDPMFKADEYNFSELHNEEGVFCGTTSLRYEGTLYQSDPQQANRKSHWEFWCCLSLIVKIANIPMNIENTDVKVVSSKVIAPAPQDNSHKVFATIITTEELQNLNKDNFSSQLKQALKNETFTEMLAQHCELRLHQGILQPNDIMLLLFKNSDYPNLKRNIVLLLQSQPHLAKQVIHELSQISSHTTHPCVFNIRENSGKFLGFCEFQFNGKKYYSETGECNSKKKLEQLCCLSIIIKITDLFEKPITVFTPLSKPTQSQSNSVNYKGELLEFCNKYNILQASYDHSSYGPIHNPLHECTCTVFFNGTDVIQTAQGGTKKIAEHRASELVLQRLQKLLS